MTTVHVGLACSSEELADRFYRDLLGLQKAEPKTLPQSLSSAIFGIAADLKIINYSGAAAHFEIFIPVCPHKKSSPSSMSASPSPIWPTSCSGDAP